MKQIVQNYKSGAVALKEVPVPLCRAKSILVRNQFSLVSIGTERMTIELGKKSLLGKARARPDLVKRVLDKARKEGIGKTFKEAMGRLDVPTPLGYSCAGEVVESGIAAHDFAPGDRVACIGQGFASHAEYISVPVNLTCRIPENVSSEEASFGMLGIIALHGIRKAELTFGSTVVVIGLGLLGLLTVQLLKAYGCRVIALDPVANKTRVASDCGAEYAFTKTEDLVDTAANITNGHGVDAVIITAGAKSSEPVDVAVELCRMRGKIVLVGTSTINPDRNEMWRKELELVVSKAAGPGSLDPQYENEGIDIPIGDARWTQKRNLSEFLRLISERKLNLNKLITHRFTIDQAERVYADLLSTKLENPIGVLFSYSENTRPVRHIQFPELEAKKSHSEDISISVIGAGLFAKSLLLPTLRKLSGVRLETLITASGISGEHNARRFGFQACASDWQEIFNDSKTNAVVAIAPHHLHAQIAEMALQCHKPLLIEKPLCVTKDELDNLETAILSLDSMPILMVGHNRRFSPHALKMREWLSKRCEPMMYSLRVNAGFVPREHWVHSDKQGRSRIVGEMSHFIDMLIYLSNEYPIQVHAERIAGNNKTSVNNDNVTITVKLSNGSLASIVYTGLGYKGYPREQLEIFFDGKTIASKDFRRSELHTQRKVDRYKSSGQEMGYKQELKHFVQRVQGEMESKNAVSEMLITMRTVFAIEESLATGETISLRQ